MARRSIKQTYHAMNNNKNKKNKNHPPAPKNYPPPPNNNEKSPSVLSSIAGGLLHGFSFGAGSEIAHRTIETVSGPRTIHVENNNTELNCLQIQELYNKCLTVPNNECSHIHDMLIKFKCNSI